MRVYQALTVIALLAACGSQKASQLKNFANLTEGPDPFLIVPTKELVNPDDPQALPEPTPGGANLADPNPKARALVALGGASRSAGQSGVPISDAALVEYAARNGVERDIRQSLANADLTFRKRNGRLQQLRVFVQDKYTALYRREILDSSAENDRYRKAGIRTPAAPPDHKRRR